MGLPFLGLQKVAQGLLTRKQSHTAILRVGLEDSQIEPGAE